MQALHLILIPIYNIIIQSQKSFIQSLFVEAAAEEEAEKGKKKRLLRTIQQIFRANF